MFSRGIDNFDKLIRDGKYDQLLIKPRSIWLQVFGSDMAFDRLSRIIQSLIIMFATLSNLNAEWNVLRVITLFNMVLGLFPILTKLRYFLKSYWLLIVGLIIMLILLYF